MVDSFRHLILPAIALGTIPLAIIARITRSSLLEVLGQDYVRTARAKGLGERGVVLRHAARNALLPVVTIIGLQLGALLSGAVLTETVFNLAGVGRSLYEAITGRDYVVIQGFTLLIALIYVVDQSCRRHLVRLPRPTGASAMNTSLEPGHGRSGSRRTGGRRATPIVKPLARHRPERPSPAVGPVRADHPRRPRPDRDLRQPDRDPRSVRVAARRRGRSDRPGCAVHPSPRLPRRSARAHPRHGQQLPRRLQPRRLRGADVARHRACRDRVRDLRRLDHRRARRLHVRLDRQHRHAPDGRRPRLPVAAARDHHRDRRGTKPHQRPHRDRDRGDTRVRARRASVGAVVEGERLRDGVAGARRVDLRRPRPADHAELDHSARRDRARWASAARSSRSRPWHSSVSPATSSGPSGAR